MREIPDSDAVCTACRWRGGHADDCPRRHIPWPTIKLPDVDTATESVERLAALDVRPRLSPAEASARTLRQCAAVVRALAAERDALLAVARAARDDLCDCPDCVKAYRRTRAALDSLPPGTLDQSEG